MKFRNIILMLLVILSSTATMAAPVDVKQYLALRKKLMTQIPFETLKADAGSYIGKVFEVRGTVSGFSKNEKGSSIIIDSPNSGSLLVNVDSLPSENPPIELGCLVRIGKQSTHSLSDLELVACTYNVDLKRIDEAAKKAIEAKAAKIKAAQAKAAEAKSQPKQTESNQTNSQQPTADQLIQVYRNAIKGFNPKLTDKEADTIAKSVLGFSQKYKVDARLVCAVIFAESHFKVEATSGVGAQGLGQLMPGTAAGLGVNNAYDPVENIYGSVRYIKSMLDRMSGNKQWTELTWNDLALALAAYNAGAGAVKKHGGVPPYKETQNYVRKVLSIYKQFCGIK